MIGIKQKKNGKIYIFAQEAGEEEITREQGQVLIKMLLAKEAKETGKETFIFSMALKEAK